jgi:predicted nucleotidyltransferase component of viral defense system
MKRISNVSASVRERLLNKARSERRPFNELLQYYAMERFLFRLSKSQHADRFILKGALMLRVWCAPQQRPTMDIDLLGTMSNQEADVIAQIHDILGVSVKDDGIAFDRDSLRTEQITADAEYEGLRVRFVGHLGTAKVSMQIDVGFGDIVYPNPVESELPTILDDIPPRLLCYSMESVVAEKLEAMVSRGALNSKVKDFYDIWMLSRQFAFNGADLSEAIRQTFTQRESEVSRNIAAFSESFTDSRQVQWESFRKRILQENVPLAFQEVVAVVEEFLGPVLDGLEVGTGGPDYWDGTGEWK